MKKSKAGRPKIFKKGPRRINLHIDPALYKIIEKRAKKQKMPINVMLRELLATTLTTAVNETSHLAAQTFDPTK